MINWTQISMSEHNVPLYTMYNILCIISKMSVNCTNAHTVFFLPSLTTGRSNGLKYMANTSQYFDVILRCLLHIRV